MPINLFRLKQAIDTHDDVEVEKIIAECKKHNETLKVFLYYGEEKVALLSYAIDVCSSNESSQNIVMLLATAVDGYNRSLVHLDIIDDTLCSPIKHVEVSEWIPQPFKEFMIDLLRTRISDETKIRKDDDNIRMRLGQAIYDRNLAAFNTGVAEMIVRDISFDFKVGPLPLLGFAFAVCFDDESSEKILTTLLALPSINVNRRCSKRILPVDHLILTDSLSIELKERLLDQMIALKDHKNAPKLKVDIEVFRSAISRNYAGIVARLLKLCDANNNKLINVNAVHNNRTILDFTISLGKGIDERIVSGLRKAGAKRFAELYPTANGHTTSPAQTFSSSSVSSTAAVKNALPTLPGNGTIEFYKFKKNHPLLQSIIRTVNDSHKSAIKTGKLWKLIACKMNKPVKIENYHHFDADLAEIEKMTAILQKFDNMIIQMPHQSMDAIFINLFLKVILGGLDVNDDELGIEDFQRLDVLINRYQALLEKDFTSQQADNIYGFLTAAIEVANKKHLTSVGLFELLDESFKAALRLFEVEPERPRLAAKS